MKTLALALLTLITYSPVDAGTPMKIEGTCSGNLSDGTDISFTYYSNYNGCQKVSKAAISFTKGFEGLFTGKRRFSGSQDIYRLNGGHKLILSNSTGNTSAKLTYPDDLSGKKKTMTFQCEVRDYEYGDC